MDFEDILYRCTLELGGAEKYISQLLKKLLEFEYFHRIHFKEQALLELEQHNKTTIGTISPQTLKSFPFSKGVMLCGEPGCGKSKLALTVSKFSGFEYSATNCISFFKSDLGASERAMFDSFHTDNKSIKILIIENIDILFGNGKATTNRMSSVSNYLVRSNRLDTVINISISTAKQREQVFEIMTKSLPINKEIHSDLIKNVVFQAHGFSASDLQNLCLQAFFEFNKRLNGDDSNKTRPNHLEIEDFLKALTTVKPSTLGEYTTKIPKVFFSDIYGLNTAINDLMSSVVRPLKNIDKYENIGIEPPRGILIHGPPGVGKSMLSYAITNELKINSIFVDSTDLRSMVVGQSEKAIQRLFEKARSTSPCLLVFDHFEMLARCRNHYSTSEGGSNRIVTSLLTVTDKVDDIDPALIRPGRIDVAIKLDLPDKISRISILEGVLKKIPNQISKQYLEAVAEKTQGWNGSELFNICQLAAMVSLRNDPDLSKI
ncbi:hypothetical protein BB560_003104 [Smittium megazygosporum]|uniref:AAA+ ATPase domain-containing protein n=1 Tax=Smittium megazygosporum TaxID=133381 RepID=A0A2T9ZCW8_9FUNG|nr:hypothetical protein BB560_003104 [Smittium megazygosporum]